MKRQVSLLTLFIACIFSQHRVFSQDRTSAELDDWMINELNNSGVNSKYLKSNYNLLVESDRFGANCDTVHLAAFMWCQLKVQLTKAWNEPFPLDSTTCPVRNHALHFALGMKAYMDWDLGTMEEQMRLALASSTRDYHRHVSWQGLGLVFQLTDRLDSAYIAFAESYNAAPDEVDPIGMNNLANAALLADEYEAALSWTIKAEESYYVSIRQGRPANAFGPYFPDLVLSNRLLAEMKLADTLAADSTFDRMPLDLVDDPMGVMLGATSVAYLLWRDRADRFDLLSPVLTKWLAMDSVQAVEVMGAHVLLCEPWRQNWLAISGMKEDELWDFVRDLPLEFRDVAMPQVEHKEVVEEDASSFQAKSYLPPLAVFSTLVAALLFLARHRRQVQLDEADLPQLKHWVEAGMEGKGSSRLGRMALRRLIQDIPMDVAHLEPDLNLSVLTPRELDIYRAWTRGERPKATAARVGISASAVYNLRVLVKKKLGVPEGAEFEVWLQERAKEKP